MLLKFKADRPLIGVIALSAIELLAPSFTPIFQTAKRISIAQTPRKFIGTIPGYPIPKSGHIQGWDQRIEVKQK